MGRGSGAESGAPFDEARPRGVVFDGLIVDAIRYNLVYAGDLPLLIIDNAIKNGQWGATYDDAEAYFEAAELPLRERSWLNLLGNVSLPLESRSPDHDSFRPRDPKAFNRAVAKIRAQALRKLHAPWPR